MMAANMDWYDRMALDVLKMISVIEKHPEVWDRASEEYKASSSKHDAWPAIATEIYPQWPQLPKSGQKIILADIKNRWRSVTDRLVKSQRTESGSSPSNRRVPYADQLQFTSTSRNLHRTEGNVRAQTPPVHEGNRLDHDVEEEVEDFPMCSSPNPPLPMSSSSLYAAVTAPSCTVASSSSAVDATLVSTAVAPASGAAPSSAGGDSRPTGKGVGSARPVPLMQVTVGIKERTHGYGSSADVPVN
ncbi:unnamed protein product [Ranitomeya imitator]|uniref:MADF domain-containing protein n=1 Tax=Ranitomeya imitator TaxID=111125 RepID=A0ABN9L2V6_9NEOB|nr:unnamed protein product [Ranitomeya imitator]